MRVPPREPFVLAAVFAVVPLLALSAAAPGGGDWRWLELPRGVTLVAAALGMALCFARSRQLAPLVLLGTAAFALVWEIGGEYVGLSRFGRTDLLGRELGLLVDHALARAAPWFVGGSYAVLAWLSIDSRSRSALAARRRAGAWLVGIALVAVVLTLENRSWLTFENIGHAGTYRDSTAWPDSKQFSLVVDIVAAAIGAAMIVFRRREPERIPRATVRE